MFRIFLILFFTSLLADNNTPVEFWNNYTLDEKIAFINGAYGASAKLKSHHKAEVKKQFIHDDNWIEPYYIERFYEIADEYRSKKVGYNLKIIALHMDAFYTNSDNFNIPILEALRIVSLVEDGDKKTANIRLLRAQQRFNN